MRQVKISLSSCTILTCYIHQRCKSMSNATMTHDENIRHVDTSKALSSLPTKYDFYMHESDTFEWDGLSNLNISKSDIDRLIYVLGVKSEHKIISPVDRHHSCNRYYKCQNCTDFRLHFDNKEIYYQLIPKRSRRHNIYCSSTN